MRTKNVEVLASDVKAVIDERQRKRRKTIRTIQQDIVGWLMGGWPFIGAMIFGAVPSVIGYILPFMELHTFDYTQMEFVGFDNFKWLLFDEKSMFWLSLKNSLYYTVSVPIYLGIALFVAVQLDKNIKGTGVFRVIMFLPTFVSSVAMSIFWQFVFEPTGAFNSVLSLFGVAPIDFLGEELWFMPSVILTGTWGACANSVLFQAALANVDVSMKEAARIDGATERQTFWKITFSMISPTTFYQLLMSLVGALQVFTSLQLMARTSTGPNGAALSVVLYMYNMAYQWTGPDYGLGMAGACGLMYQTLLVALTLIIFKTKKKWVYDND
ncbi:MAG: carbohydrate ABC transporter permease [Candidatus Scatosoma sp.]